MHLTSASAFIDMASVGKIFNPIRSRLFYSSKVQEVFRDPPKRKSQQLFIPTFKFCFSNVAFCIQSGNHIFVTLYYNGFSYIFKVAA